MIIVHKRHIHTEFHVNRDWRNLDDDITVTEGSGTRETQRTIQIRPHITIRVSILKCFSWKWAKFNNRNRAKSEASYFRATHFVYSTIHAGCTARVYQQISPRVPFPMYRQGQRLPFRKGITFRAQRRACRFLASLASCYSRSRLRRKSRGRFVRGERNGDFFSFFSFVQLFFHPFSSSIRRYVRQSDARFRK